MDQNWRGSGPGEHPEKTWDPYVFLQPLKLATSNSVHELGLGLAYQKRRLGPKLAGVWARGASKKIWDPLIICATVKASNFKFGTQLGLGLPYQKTTFWTKIGGDLGQESIRKEFMTPYVFLQLLKLAASNMVHKLGLGLA